MKSIEEANIIEGTRVLVRVDWNVPIEDGKILDTSRIEASVKTINYILEKGGKAIIMSHLGDGADSLEVVAKEAEKFFTGRQVRFVRDPWNCSAPDCKKALEYLNNGGVAIIENLRFWTEKENDESFARKLAEFGDIYVNEAFPVSHRAHTSLVALPKLLPHYAGFSFLNEVEHLSQVFNPEHPFLFILGGAKFETKLPLVEKFLNIADDIFIGGANALPASGKSFADNSKIIFPVGEYTALDANGETLEILNEKIKEAKFVLWNGPLGDYEKGFVAGTVALARMLAESNAKIIIGGGDTLAVVPTETKNKISTHGFISTAGGAMLDFLANGTLPGIEALNSP
jgi:3-phosphoglycerate kinase